jgi:predicted GIY-YIG superfamily endonuclease
VVDIYVLECEDGNVYVGKTTKGEKRLKQHIDGRGAEWTKMHKPKQVMQYYTNATDADERKVTDQMIKKYGAKKVRGAGLTKRKMTKKEIDNLNKKVGFTKTKTQTRSRKKSTTTKKRNSKAKAAKSSTKKKSKSKWIAPGYKKDRFGRIVPKTARDYAAEKKSKSTTTKKKSTAKKKTTTRKKTSSSPKRKRTTSRSKSTSSRSRYYRRR